jgi:hypothetical protein
MEFEKNPSDMVENSHNLNLRRVLRIGLVTWGEIGRGINWKLIGNVKIPRTSPTFKWKAKHFLHERYI